MMKKLLIGLVALCGAIAGAASLDEARRLYEHTDYSAAIAKLSGAADVASVTLLGKSYYMLGDYKKATEVLERAKELDPQSSEVYMWLGRVYGRRAETAFALAAPHLANQARENMERAVALNPKNWEAQDDLFEYYLNAPGFLGGGVEKAAKVAETIGAHNAADGAFAEARLAAQKKQFDVAEARLRKAIELDPKKASRVAELAAFLAKHGRVEESDAEFAKALKADPNSAGLVFARAQALIAANRNLPEARELLKRFLAMDLTPDDPSRADAQKLLKKAGN